jgi:hypothetical protein
MCSSHRALRSSDFAHVQVVERASLARPTGAVDDTEPLASSDRLSSNPVTRSDGPPASLREALRVGVLREVQIASA